ncbi:hypothetical protein [Microbacterium allomyrinae]|uniref:Phage gp6-like head-tail connector protein n=1 Tax=Microbacterium allomyrinae TaxID=2830666 RepID=A0A9X1LRU7_9MICO|nr:hypothetical protein [Microbacterium allomyrinae]MCC2030618.1 phage gp6-like head-tail connector protein [Microbacterium allomyrinae]
MASNWPLTAVDLRNALQYGPTQEDTEDLEFYAAVASEEVDKSTGRHVDPERHEIDGRVPLAFILAGKKLAKHLWQQDRKGQNARPTPGEDDAPQGFAWPHAVVSLLEPYPPRPGFGA